VVPSRALVSEQLGELGTAIDDEVEPGKSRLLSASAYVPPHLRVVNVARVLLSESCLVRVRKVDSCLLDGSCVEFIRIDQRLNVGWD
jgi:hypothetical protein